MDNAESEPAEVRTIRELAFSRIGKRKTAQVPMPEWGHGTIIYFREMSAAERDDYEAGQVERNKTGKSLVNFRARLVAATCLDCEGERIFTDADVPALGEMPAGEIRRLFDAAAKLNAMTAEEEKDLEKNS